MRKVEYWEAKDGEMFDTEEECLEYENRHGALENVPFFKNDTFELYRKTDTIDTKLEYCYGFYAKDSTTAQAVDDAMSEISPEAPSKYHLAMQKGLYFHDGEQWRHLESEIRALEDVRRKFMSQLPWEC